MPDNGLKATSIEIWSYKRFIRLINGKNIVDVDIMFSPMVKVAFEMAEALGNKELKGKRLKIFEAYIEEAV